MSLDNGYYWIAYRGVGPRISRWDGMFWYGEHYDGLDGCFDEEHVKVLSRRRVKPPATVVRKLQQTPIE